MLSQGQDCRHLLRTMVVEENTDCLRFFTNALPNLAWPPVRSPANGIRREPQLRQIRDITNPSLFARAQSQL